MFLAKQLTEAFSAGDWAQFGGKHPYDGDALDLEIDGAAPADKDLNRTINKLMETLS